jgi:hypothetical protein
VAGRYVGGVYIHRDHKGDPDGRDPLLPVEAEKQRRAMQFVIDNAFPDEAFDLRPDVFRKLTTDKHRHWGHVGSADPVFSIHDHVAQIQAFALLYLMNPGTLTRVYDNELRTEADADALTLPEVMGSVTEAVFTELHKVPADAAFTNRKPMISSLRRNLQSAMTARLIDLAMDGAWMPRPIQTLARDHLVQIDTRLSVVLDQPARRPLDRYSRVHLEDLKRRIERALNAVYVTGTWEN